MAKYIGTITSDIRNKLGGVVFSKTANITTLRSNAHPIAPDGWGTTKQQIIWVSANAAWQALTGLDNVGYTIFAAFMAYIAGTNPDLLAVATLTYFTVCYTNGSYIGTLPVVGPNLQPALPNAVDGLTLTVSAGVFTATVTQGGGTPTSPWMLYLLPNQPNGNVSPPSQGGYLMGGSATAATEDFTAQITAVLGQLPKVGSWACARLVTLYPYFLYTAIETDITLQIGG